MRTDYWLIGSAAMGNPNPLRKKHFFLVILCSLLDDYFEYERDTVASWFSSTDTKVTADELITRIDL